MEKKLKLAFWPAVILTFAMAIWLRTVGQDWDEGQGLHPDERFVLMVAGSIETVDSLSEYFDTHKSTMNPHNKDFGFYVYGTVPLFFLRLAEDYLQTNKLHILARQIAAYFDLASLILIFLISLQFFGRLVAFLALVFYGFAVLPIQLSHFGTFDIHGAFFCTLGLFVSFQSYNYFLKAKRLNFSKVALLASSAGLAAALAGATKINLLASFGLFPLSMLLALWQRRAEHSEFTIITILKICILSTFFAALVLALGFRFFQPIAFDGPAFWDFSFNQKWLKNIDEIIRLSKPDLGFPPAVQWIERTRIHSFLNIMQWGLGLALGIFSLFAAAYALNRIYFKKVYILAIPLVWLFVGMVLFSFMPLTQPMRYSIPIFSCYAILSAILAKKLLTGSLPWLVSKWSNTEQLCAKVLAASVVIFSILWGFSFVQIYKNTNTRIAASRWIFQNIPAAFNFELLDGSKLPVPVAGEKESLFLPAEISFWPNKNFSSNRILFPKLQNAQGKNIQIIISEDSKILLEKNIKVDQATIQVALGSVLDFKQSTQYKIKLTPIGSEYIYAAGSRIELRKINLIKESSWDDSLPARMDNFDPYGGIYRGDPNLEIYWRDHQIKAERMADVLSKADYFYLSSNRQVGTVGRLPKAFPIAAVFYQRLLGCSAREYIPACYAYAKVGDRQGDLGFSLVKTFESYPRLFGIEFNTQLADEPFQVYDHPKVMIFKNDLYLSAQELKKRITPARLEPVEYR